MKINIAPDLAINIDGDFVKAAFSCFSDIEALTVLRELVGGKTRASVLLVDIVTTNQAANKTPDGSAPSGQFVLKIDERAKGWHEPAEAERHLRAIQWGEPRFSANHIPKLRHSFEADNKLLMLYDIAGLSRLRLSNYQHLGVGVHAACCGLVSTSLLTQLNENYTVDSAVSARQSLEDWLGYRLDAIQGKRIYDFAAAHTLDKPTFTDSGRIYLNPLWVCNLDKIAADKTCTRFLGYQHGDLHTGNLFFDRVSPLQNPFWIIDWALSRECPLFFDQAYFEVSLLIRELSGKPHERLATLLEAADGDDSKSDQSMLPQEHMALAASMRELRGSLSAWQQAKEPNRRDPFVHQCLLARIAAGLNWSNKPMEEQDRRLAFVYAAKAATDFMRLFHVPDYETAIRAADTAASLVPFKAPTEEAISNEEWSKHWGKLAGFDESEYAFVLVSGSLKGPGDRSSLGFLPWAAVIDLDPQSEDDGLHASASAVLSKRRSLSWFGKDRLPVNFQRGTAWMMANGWPSRKDAIPPSFEAWRRDYLRKIRELSSEVRTGTAPKPVKVVILSSDNISEAMFARVIEAIDEEIGETAEFILIGDPDRELADHPLIKERLPFSVEAFLHRLHSIFGSDETASCPLLPGLSGPVEIRPDTLRNWEEDLEVLHSLILETGRSEDSDASKFFRGMPPTWRDLEANLDVARDVAPQLLNDLDGGFRIGRNFTVDLWHSPGAGGTTAAFRAAWELRIKHPTLILRRYSRLTADRIDAVFQKTQRPVLVVADASDLPGTAREELFRELGQRNARIGLLYLIRSPKKDADAAIQIFDPMEGEKEVKDFLETYLPRCKNDYRRRRLTKIADLRNPSVEVYRSPFFFGLTAFEEDFLSLDRYVGTHLAGIAPLARQTMLYLALATRFSQKGLSEAFFRRLFQPAISGDLNSERALGVGPARLVVHANSRVKFIHPLLAEEALRELLGGTGRDDWKVNLKELCVQLIRDVVAIVGSYSDEAKELFTQLFIFREPWTDIAGLGKRQFSPLIEAIASVDGQQQVLTLLTEVCPLEPHYWNHLGRHLIYKTNENFSKAEEFLLKAVELSQEKDALHFHALGMVRRFWARNLLNSLFKNASLAADSLSAELVLENVGDLTATALDAFAKARELNADDEHGYITPIQTILMVSERMCQASGYASVAELCSRDDEVGRWMQKRISEAEELLARLQHFRGRKKQSEHERRCQVTLTALYGNFDELIATWEKILDGSATQAWLRKAVAHAYVARRGRNWSALAVEELRKIVELSECNLGFNPTSESDLRTWFQAYRFLPEFSFNEAIDRLQAWASRSDSVDAHYYLYILHFVRWKLGGERDEDLIQKHLKKSAELSVGRRDNSYEWFGSEPHWCPLVNSRELGGWVDQTNFFKDTSKLAFIEGTISSLKRTAGTIRIGNVTRAFFRPPSHIRESEHLNKQVHFVLGFSYERLHAWLVDLGPAPVSVVTKAVKSSSPPPHSAPTTEGESDLASPFAKLPAIEDGQDRGTLSPARPYTPPGEEDLRAAAFSVISSLLKDRMREEKQLTTAVVGNKLRDRFPGSMPPHERLGFRTVRALVQSWNEFQVSGKGVHVVIRFANSNLEEADSGDLRSEVAAVIAALIAESSREERILQLPTVGAKLAKMFPASVPLFRRLGFSNLTELIRSYDDFEVVWQAPRWIVVRRSQAP
jgi:hypothetical protein